MLAGKGLAIQEYTKIGIAFDRISNSTLVKKTRKIYKIIRDKGKSFTPSIILGLWRW